MATMTKTRYHHGNLAEALVDAGRTACRAEGPGGLVIRDLAASVGVSPAAAYRHFANIDHLRATVSQRAREELARRMLAAVEADPGGGTPAERARRRFTARGAAYIRFALDEPHLFETAFAACPAQPDRPDEPDAWQVLVDAIDELIAAGATPETMRTEAPWIAWSAVHGLSSILVNQALPAPVEVDRMIEAVLLGLERALT